MQRAKRLLRCLISSLSNMLSFISDTVSRSKLLISLRGVCAAEWKTSVAFLSNRANLPRSTMARLRESFYNLSLVSELSCLIYMIRHESRAKLTTSNLNDNVNYIPTHWNKPSVCLYVRCFLRETLLRSSNFRFSISNESSAIRNIRGVIFR